MRFGWLCAVLFCGCGLVTDLTGLGPPDGAADAEPDVAPPPPPPPGQPPPRPDGGLPTASVYTFALRTLHLGEADRAGTPSASAWQRYGYDLDGLVTTDTSTDVCTLATGAAPATQVDGVDGIDNAWGAILVPLMTSFGGSSLSQAQNDRIAAGGSTLLVEVKGLSDDPLQTAVDLVAQVFVTDHYANGTPAFDTSTTWPVLASSVSDSTNLSSGAVVHFDAAYVSNGTFVSGPSPAALTLPLAFQGAPFVLRIHQVVLTFDHASHGEAKSGILAGVLDPQELVDTMRSSAGQISPTLCSGGVIDAILAQVDQAREIFSTGSNAPNAPCDAISIGIGFEASLVHEPTTVVQDPPPPADPCGG